MVIYWVLVALQLIAVTAQTNCEIFDQLIYPELKGLNSDAPNIDCCDDVRVICGFSGTITHLKLSKLGLNGKFPENLIYLSDLESVDFSENNLEGNFPSNIASNWILNSINVYKNRMSGSIPDFLGDIVSLSECALSTNNFSGPIPESLGNLVSLSVLDLSSNFLTGGIPSSFENLFLMKWLDLSNNQLSGTLPDFLWHIPGLLIFTVRENKFTGNISEEIVNLAPSLAWLDLSLNSFSGPIPQNLWKLTNLAYFDISFNSLTGTISPEIENLTWLMIFSVGSNLMTGTVPDKFSTLTGLELLALNGNSFNGPLPPSIGYLPSLSYLFLFNNSFSGPIPDTYSFLSKVTILFMHDNKLTGSIPPNFSNLTSLMTCDFNGNELTGYIPNGFSAQSFGGCAFPSTLCIRSTEDVPLGCSLVTFEQCARDDFCFNESDFYKNNPKYCQKGKDVVLPGFYTPEYNLLPLFLIIFLAIIGLILLLLFLAFLFPTPFKSILKTICRKEFILTTLCCCLIVASYIIIPDIGNREGFRGYVAAGLGGVQVSTIIAIFTTIDGIVLGSAATYSLSHLSWSLIQNRGYPLTALDAANNDIVSGVRIFFGLLSPLQKKFEFYLVPLFVVLVTIFQLSESTIIQLNVQTDQIATDPIINPYQYRNTSLISSRQFVTGNKSVTSLGKSLMLSAISDLTNKNTKKGANMFVCPSAFLYCEADLLITTDYSISCNSSTSFESFQGGDRSNLRNITSYFVHSNAWQIERQISKIASIFSFGNYTIDTVTCYIQNAITIRRENSVNGTVKVSEPNIYVPYNITELVGDPFEAFKEAMNKYLIGTCISNKAQSELECDKSLMMHMEGTTIGTEGDVKTIEAEMRYITERYFKRYMENAPLVNGSFQDVGYRAYTWTKKSFVLGVMYSIYAVSIILIGLSINLTIKGFPVLGADIITVLKYINPASLSEFQSDGFSRNKYRIMNTKSSILQKKSPNSNTSLGKIVQSEEE
ncbi:hypothetical protein BC833DRAFT_577572 [Globomyces pollinis-pini]|nr:hypothetical protein BC833DRAFT_577572 [Globomyces pollinis-pini]